MHKGFLATAIIFGILSVILGAFAAHKLRETVSDYAVNIFETGVRYQFYHVFALLAAGILFKEYPGKWLKASGWFFILGILLFCGSLYALMFVKAAVLPGYNWLGPITPVGGLMFIMGWICLLIAVLKKKNVYG
ncbi:MAG: DUF423 domain-containing protein [Chitinophagaceae bacterium]